MCDTIDRVTPKPKSISVVIPAYNASRFLAETLESALAQTLPPDEVLVIDDGSTDDTATIAARYASRVRVISRTNHGLPASRNFGVEASTGEWIAFLDSDDVWEPNMLERQMEELTKANADVSYTGRVLLMQQGGTATLGEVMCASSAKDIRKVLFYQYGPFVPSSVVVRRSSFEAVNGFDPTMRRGNEDFDLWLRMLHAGAKFTSCPEPLLRYRRHEANWSLDRTWMESCLEVYRRHVLPYLPRSTQWIAYNRFRSGPECDCAFTLRLQGNPDCLSMMARSIRHWPFGYSARYKVFAHMLYMRLKVIFQRLPAGEAR